LIIENEVKLDFKDVLFRPMRSTLRSRSEVELERTFTFKRSNQTWTGVPIMSANMDTVSTFEMAEALMNHKMLTVVHKHYSVGDWQEFITKSDHSKITEYVVPSIGTSDDDLDKFRKIYELNNFKFLCIDVANGYGEYFPEFIRKVREEFPETIIIAGNVASGDMTQELILSGADIIKVGVGPGCFIPGTQVKTQNGNKNIEDIVDGDIVITHTGEWQKVINTVSYNNEDEMISVNGIVSTKSHEYYVVEKQYKDIITDDNIHEYAKWIPAGDLDKDKYFLLKHN
jgi:GMP reductase